MKLVLVSESFCVLDNHLILNHINTFVGGLLVKKTTNNKQAQQGLNLNWIPTYSFLGFNSGVSPTVIVFDSDHTALRFY